MGPRKAVVKRVVSTSRLERRTKLRHDESPLQFMADRVITTGRKLDFNFLTQEGFQMGDWLKAQGWEKFCSLDIPIFSRLVKSGFRSSSHADTMQRSVMTSYETLGMASQQQSAKQRGSTKVSSKPTMLH